MLEYIFLCTPTFIIDPFFLSFLFYYCIKNQTYSNMKIPDSNYGPDEINKYGIISFRK